jgi:hypothetical protein
VTAYRIAEHRHIHACPCFPDGHAWSISRRVLEVVTSGPCLTPVPQWVTTSGVDELTTVDCARRLLDSQRCTNCRVSIDVVEISLHLDLVAR